MITERGLFGIPMAELRKPAPEHPLWVEILFALVTLPIGLFFAVTFWFWVPLGIIVAQIVTNKEIKEKKQIEEYRESLKKAW